MLTTVSQKLNLTCKKNTVSASNVLDSAITKLQNLRVASNVVASTWALVSNGMVMWVRHRWRSWYGNDSNMWMVLLLNVIATIFGIGLLYKRSNKFLLEDLFETPQQIHVVCTCHENYEPRISPVWFPHAVTLRTNPGWKALAKAAPQHKHTRKSTYSSRANVVFFQRCNAGFSTLVFLQQLEHLLEQTLFDLFGWRLTTIYRSKGKQTSCRAAVDLTLRCRSADRLPAI